MIIPPDVSFEIRGLDTIAQRFDISTDEIVQVREQALSTELPRLQEDTRALMQSVTPRQTGRLALSTQIVNEVREPGFASFDIAQPAESRPNLDGTGGGEHYVQWVVEGRGAIIAGQNGSGKKALAGPFFGPVHSVGPAAPNPYPTEVRPQMVSAVDLMATRWGYDVLNQLNEIL